jgi:hypothetical protein
MQEPFRIVIPFLDLSHAPTLVAELGPVNRDPGAAEAA